MVSSAAGSTSAGRDTTLLGSSLLMCSVVRQHHQFLQCSPGARTGRPGSAIWNWRESRLAPLPIRKARPVTSPATRSAGGDQPVRGARLPRRARRAQLLGSALEVFVAQGYHAAAMDDIAENAGVSKPVLYQHFPGKLDLYLALLDQAVEKVIAGTREALESTDDNKQRVAATMHAFFTYVASEQGEFRLVFESDLTNEPAVRERVDRVTTECAGLIAHVIHDDTGLPDEESRLLAVALVGMGQVSARFWLQDRLQGSVTIEQDTAAGLVAGLAWRGIRGYPRNDETS